MVHDQLHIRGGHQVSLARRWRAGAQHQHRQQRRPAVRSEGYRDDRHPTRRLLRGVRGTDLRRLQCRAAVRIRAQPGSGTASRATEACTKPTISSAWAITANDSGTTSVSTSIAANLGLETPVAGDAARSRDRSRRVWLAHLQVDGNRPVAACWLLRGDHYQVPTTPEDQAAGIDDLERERDGFINVRGFTRSAPGLPDRVAVLPLQPRGIRRRTERSDHHDG